MSTGKGNVIRQAEMLRDLGVKPTKSLAAPLVELAMEDGTDSPVIQLAVPEMLPDEVGSPLMK